MKLNFFTMLLCVLLLSCADDPKYSVDKNLPFDETFKLKVLSTQNDPVKVNIMTLEYRSYPENFGENGIRIGTENWAVDSAEVGADSDAQLSIDYFFGWDGDDGSIREHFGCVSSFLIEVEFEDGTKQSYWGIPEKYDVNGYNATVYGIAYVADTEGLRTVYDEEKRFSDFGLIMTVNSPDDIVFEVDYDNSTEL